VSKLAARPISVQNPRESIWLKKKCKEKYFSGPLLAKSVTHRKMTHK